MSTENDVHEFIEKYNIYVFHFNDGPTTKVFVNDKLLWFHIKHMTNNNFVFLVIGENCVIIPTLCATRWNYFNAIITRRKSEFSDINGALIINITQMLIDSQILKKIRYAGLGWSLTRFLHERNAYNVYMESKEIKYWKSFLDLLIPPDDYWDSTYDLSFDFGDSLQPISEIVNTN